MHEVIIERHNAVVKPVHKVYFHGDVGWKVDVLQKVIPRLNGKLRLIRGNHDSLDWGVYRKFFPKVEFWRPFTFEGECVLLCTHVPVHPDSLICKPKYAGRCLNVHGHNHNDVVRLNGVPDRRYHNVACEHVNYTPVNQDTLRALARRLPATEPRH